MTKSKVAVCDADDVYRSRFVTYLMEHRREELELHEFSQPAMVFQNLESGFELLILGKGFELLEEEAKEKQIPTLLLTEEPPAKEHEDETEEAAVVRVFKYQSMEVIWHEIYALAGSRMGQSVSVCAQGKTLEVIGVYSPAKHEMQLAFSLAFAALLAKERKVLYINLMENCPLQRFLTLPENGDMGDLMIRIRRKRLSIEEFKRAVYRSGEIYCLPPFLNPEDLHEISQPDIEAVLTFLKEKTDFDVVFWDFGQGIKQFAEVLKMCSSIYCPTKNGYYYDCLKEQFMRYLTMAGADGISEYLSFLDLPFVAKAIHGGGSILEQLLWSEFGDYVRAYVTGGTSKDEW